MSIAAGLLASLVDSPSGLSDFIRLGLGPELFKGPEETASWDLTYTHVVKYGQMPTRARYADEKIDLPLTHPDPLEWYADQLRSRHTHHVMKQCLLDVQSHLNADKPKLGLEAMVASVMQLTRTQFKNKLVDFSTEGAELVLNAMKAKKLQGESYGLRTGWPTLDNMVDGVTGGDVVTIVGRPGKGKTYAMLYNAENAWDKQDKNVMFVTMEMKPLPIAQRLAAINTKKPITQLKKGELSTAAEKDLIKKLNDYSEHGRFWIVDGGLTATVQDIILLARQLKPQVVYVDGAYLVKGDDPRAQRWDRTTAVLERMKGDLAEALDIPAEISFQFNRQGAKKDAGLEHIAYADAVGQLSSVVLGLGLSDKEDSVESINKRRIEILKGRNGEMGGFDIHWRFDQGPNFMDFTEIKTIEKEDLTWGTD